jgi:hypothetical protein
MYWFLVISMMLPGVVGSTQAQYMCRDRACAAEIVREAWSIKYTYRVRIYTPDDAEFEFDYKPLRYDWRKT